MDYHLHVKTYVDMIFAYCVLEGAIQELGQMDSAEDYTSMELNSPKDYKIFNIKLPVVPIKAKFNILSYGEGGTAEYPINQTLSLPINVENLSHVKDIFGSEIIINTPNSVRYCLVEFSQVLQKLLQLPKYYHLTQLDKKSVQTANSFTNNDMIARGIDPQGKTWICKMIATLPKWASERPSDFERHVNTMLPIIVHCFTYSGMQTLDITAPDTK